MLVTALFAITLLVSQMSSGEPATPQSAPTPSPVLDPLFTTGSGTPIELPAAFVGRVLLHADVNGHLMWLHLDTGNYGMLLGTDDSRKAGLEIDPVTHDSRPVHVAIGKLEAPAASFKIGRYGFEDHGHWVAGNIGTPLLRANVVTIDYPRQRLIFYPPGTFTPPANVQPTPFFMRYNTPEIELSFGSVVGRFDLDTGDQITEISPTFARKIRLGMETGQMISSGCGHQENDPVRLIPDFTVGGVAVKEFSAVVGNPCGISGDGLLGRDVLSHFALTLDYVNHVAYFANPSP